MNTQQSYLVGLSIGDGNLSNPNGRATRLRITCDNKYPKLIVRITKTIQDVFPENSISVIKRRDNCVDISCYSNKLEALLGWSAESGSKFEQNISVPLCILENVELTKFCLRGLIETDGSVYIDRTYLTVNFVTIIPNLAKDVAYMISNLGYISNTQTFKPKIGELKYTVRISRSAKQFIETVGIDKS